MCCLVASLFMFGPRAAIVVWWLLQPVRWAETFDTAIWPIIGFALLPWMTLMYVLVFPGGIDTIDFIWLAIGLGMDAFTWFGGGASGRNRMTATPAA